METPSPSKPRTAMVSGGFDLLHPGHIAFLESAASYGDLTVCLRSDRTVAARNQEAPVLTEEERRYLLSSIRFVRDVRVSRGGGILDFEGELAELKPDVFVVTEDDHSPARQSLCEQYGARYVILPRVPPGGLPARSSPGLREGLARVRNPARPYRLCLAGEGLEHPALSARKAGPVVVVNIAPDHDFVSGQGFAVHTRRLWERLGEHAPFSDEPLELARLLFGYQNPPGAPTLVGSHAALGLTLPGASCLHYDGDYWPIHTDGIADDETCDWLEHVLALIPFAGNAPPNSILRTPERLSDGGANRLSEAGLTAWEGIRERNLKKLAAGMNTSFQTWLPLLSPGLRDKLSAALNRYDAAGKSATSRTGGFLLLATENPPAEALRIRIPRGE